jgi:hypothetical protein
MKKDALIAAFCDKPRVAAATLGWNAVSEYGHRPRKTVADSVTTDA